MSGPTFSQEITPGQLQLTEQAEASRAGEAQVGLELARRYTDLWLEKKRLEVEAKSLNERLAAMEPDILKWMENPPEGVSFPLPFNNGVKLHMVKKIVARATDVDALKAYPDTAHMVKEAANASSVRSYVLQRVKDGHADSLGNPVLPDEVKDAIRVDSIITPGCYRK